jgi:hypothetical protein
VNIATIGHSAGGLAVTMLLHASATGISSQFTCSAATVDQAASWVRSGYTIAAPFLGSEVANAICAPHSSVTDVFHNLSCASVVGNIGAVLFDACNGMTNVLTTSYMSGSAWPSLKSTGAWNIYYNWGTNTGGDDSVLMAAARFCAGAPDGDGMVSTNSSTGNSSRPSNFYAGYHADQSHSENRRCDHTTTNNTYGSAYCFTQGVWNANPY